MSLWERRGTSFARSAISQRRLAQKACASGPHSHGMVGQQLRCRTSPGPNRKSSRVLLSTVSRLCFSKGGQEQVCSCTQRTRWRSAACCEKWWSPRFFFFASPLCSETLMACCATRYWYVHVEMVQALSNDGLISELSLSSWRVIQECVHIFLFGIKVISGSTRINHGIWQ